MILVNLEASTDSDSIVLANSIIETKLRPQNGRIHSPFHKLNTKFEIKELVNMRDVGILNSL